MTDSAKTPIVTTINNPEYYDRNRVKELLLSSHQISARSYEILVSKLSTQYVTFSSTIKCPNGRVYGKGNSIQWLEKDLRSYICQDSFIDLDIENCFPSILLIMAKQNGLDCDLLTSYINNRDEWIAKYPNCKIDIVSLIGGKAETSLPADIKDEIRGIVYSICHSANITEDFPTAINGILQTYEMDKIRKAMKFLDTMDIKYNYIFDGLIVEQNGIGYLSELNKLVHPLKFVQKPWKLPTIDKVFNNRYFDWEDGCYFRDLVMLNKSTFPRLGEVYKHVIPLMVRTVRQIGVSYLMKRSDKVFEFAKMPNISFNIDGTKLPLSLTSVINAVPQLLHFSNITPTNDPAIDEFSVWRGFGFKPYTGDSIESLVEPILHHIKVVLADTDEAVYDYVINWLATIVQNPFTKTEVANIFCGREGIGKSTIGFFISKLIGEWNVLKLSGLDMLTRNFNSHLMGKVIIWIEELKSAKEKDFVVEMNKIKDIIDTPTITIEEKGKETYSVKNILNVIGFSNNYYCVPIMEGINRRFMISKAGDRYQHNNEYFAGLRKLFQDPNVIDAFGTYLLNYETTSCRTIPNTELKQSSYFRYLSALDKVLLIAYVRRKCKEGYISTNEIKEIAIAYKFDKMLKDLESGRIGDEIRQKLGPQHSTKRKYHLRPTKEFIVTPNLIEKTKELMADVDTMHSETCALDTPVRTPVNIRIPNPPKI